MPYIVHIENPHYCTTLRAAIHSTKGSGSIIGQARFTSRRKAEAAGAAWKREMVAMEPDPASRREARAEYQWEVEEVG
jgi:hypothetical protein